MNPMLDPDLIEYVDDATLLEAFAVVQQVPDQDDRDVILAEMARRKPGYAEYMRRTSMLVPWPPKAP